jgi:hypothetical protein
VKSTFLAHSALRLLCNHTGYLDLWKEQIGELWREHTNTPFTWPLLSRDDERWEVRAAIDSLVADAYRLSRDQYIHVLSTFSHSSYPRAPELCISKYDELIAIGFESFSRKYDCYWDIPLNKTVPHPSIDLSIPEMGTSTPGQSAFGFESIPVAEYPTQTGDLGLKRVADGGGISPVLMSSEAQGDNYRRLRQLLEQQKVITSVDAQNLLGLDSASVRPLLKRLVEDKLAVTKGRHRGLRYVST